MSAEYVSPVFADFDRSAEVDLGEVLELRNLVRGPIITGVLGKGRKIWLQDQEPLAQSFCVMDNASMSGSDGTIDTFLGVSISEVTPQEGSMTLWVRSIEYGGDSLNDSLRGRYQLRWDECAARGRVILRASMGGHAESGLSWKLGVMGIDASHVSGDEESTIPMTDDQVSALGRQMQDIILAAKGRRRSYRSVLYPVDYYRDLEDYRARNRSSNAILVSSAA